MKLKCLLIGLLLISQSLYAQKWREMSEDVTSNYYDVMKEGNEYYSTHDHGKGSGYKQFQRWLFYMKNHIDSLGNQINIDQAYNNVKAVNLRSTQNRRTAATGANWTEIGPKSWKNSGGWAPGLGRLEAVRVDGANQNNIYVGSPGGGAWKTTDGGNTWAALTDNITPSAMFVWSIGLANGSPDSVYVGTESGILYSYNGGQSFVKATGITGTVRRIEVHPTNHKFILAASTAGIFKSTNAGQTWVSVKTGGTYDLRFKPDNPNVVYAVGTSFYKSIDGGSTFTLVTMGASGIKRLAVTAANPNYVYVAELSGQTFGAVYRSTDAGVTFTTRVTGGQAGTKYGGYNPDGNDDAGQGSYNFCFAASPSNAEEVHLGCIITWKSTNGGSSFVATTMWTYPNSTGYTHCDMHALEYIGNTLYTGSDGGIFKSTDKGDNFTDISSGLGIRMYYKFGQSATDLTLLGGGAQDNGCNLYKNSVWIDWVSADGMNTVIDWSNKNIVYGMSQNGTLYKSTNGGVSTVNISSPGGGWTNALCQDTKVATTLYFGGTSLFKTTNGGTNWTNIGTYGGQIEDIEVAESDNKYVYLCSGSSMYVSTDAAVSFTKVTGTSGSINQITVSPSDARKVYIATSSGVFVSANAGSTWTNITGALPNLGANAITMDDTPDEGVYVAMSYAVYFKNKNMSSWILYSDNLPLVDIRQLEYHKLAKKVRICTYGRGIWESASYNSVPVKPQALFIANKTTGCKTVKVKFTNQTVENLTSKKWLFPGGTPSTSTADTVSVTYTKKGTYKVSLIATNTVGTDSLVKNGFITVETIDAPVASDVVFCPTAPVKFTATKTTGNVNWYTSSDTINSVSVGDSYTTIPLQITTQFYLNANNGGTITSLGAIDNKIGTGASHGGGQYLVFDALKPFTLKSAKVYATGTKARTIQVKDSADNIIIEKIVTITDGESIVNFNLDIPAGNKMKIGFPTGSDLYRNDAGPVYPYVLNGLVSINTSTAGTTPEKYYYYLYDWKVQATATCSSRVVGVVAQLDNNCTTTAVNDATYSNESIIYPNPVQDELFINISGKLKISINNVNGALVKERTLEGSRKIINVHDLEKGVYTVLVENGEQKTLYKIVKK